MSWMSISVIKSVDLMTGGECKNEMNDTETKKNALPVNTTIIPTIIIYK
jgi:hypothetical protein